MFFNHIISLIIRQRKVFAAAFSKKRGLDICTANGARFI